MSELSDIPDVGRPAARDPARTGELRVHLDAPLPLELGVGRGSALFVAGWCVSSRSRIRTLELVVGDESHPVSAHGMPRIDVFRAFHPQLDPFTTRDLVLDPDAEDDPLLHSYASGFWDIAPVPATITGSFAVVLRAELEDGETATATLATISVVGRPPPATLPKQSGVRASTGPLVAICMATYDPPVDLFRRQVASLRAQTHTPWVCLISDDCSEPARFDAIADVVGDDERFLISRARRRQGFYRNFERALSMVPAEAAFVALADQDDVWYPEKVATLLEQLREAVLVYSDARIVDVGGQVLSNTYWGHRRNNHSDLTSLLVANSVTGAASLFRRELLDVALPFPPAQFAHFHDHWIALTALAQGDIAYVQRPLYDYVQHREASLGHARANQMTAMKDRLRNLRRDPRDRVRAWRAHYFIDAARLMQFATVLLMRVGRDMAPAKRRALERFLRSDHSFGPVVSLWARGARELVGAPETLGAEWHLAYAFTWRHALALTARDRPSRSLRLDAVPPPRLAPGPGRRGPEGEARSVAEKIAPLDLSVRDDIAPRVNVLIPTIDLEHFFGGYIGKFNLALRLAARGHRVRLVTADPVPPLPTSWRSRIEAYEGLSGFFSRVEVAFGRETPGLDVSREDRFIATTWWTAHVAASAVRAVQRDRFLYLIQEYEPFTFPMGTYAALAAESYRVPHFALFSTELLRGFFRSHGLGVFASGRAVGDASSAAFENAITDVARPDAAALAERSTRRLLFYARPEPHAERNLFHLGLLGLGRAQDAGVLDGWELRGIGTVNASRRIDVGGGVSLELLPRADQRSYAGVLGEHDVGLALMYTPHPSLVPIEMAAAGLLTVTNTFENKTVGALESISGNLVPVVPTVEGIAAGLEAAIARASDVTGRIDGSDVRWSRDWDESFGDALLARVAGFLNAA